MTKDINNVNKAGLRSLYMVDPEAKTIFDQLATFTKNMSTTKIDQLLGRLSNGQNPASRWAVIKFFKKLEELGCGRFVPGRRGKKTRLEWAANLTDVSKVAAGLNVAIGAAPPAAEVDDVAAGEPTNDLVEHPFRLRRELDVRLRLPADLTPAEAARLAAFIQTLPFDEAVPRSA
jgi:hypothetical protein